jgi:hypothetical protein
LRISGEHTFEGWVKGPSSDRGYVMAIGAKNSFQSSYRIDTHDMTDPSKARIAFVAFNNDNTYLDLTTSADVFDDTWHHIAVVGTTASGTTTTKVYVDGVLDVEDAVGYTRPTTWDNATGNPGNSNSFSVGGRANATVTNAKFGGQIDSFRTWTRTLSNAEILDIVGCGQPSDLTGLHRYFEFEGDTSELVAGKTVEIWDLGGGETPAYTTGNCTAFTLSSKENVLNATLNIYPNPARTIVTIEKQANVSLKSVALYSILGNEVYKSTNTKSINVSSFSKGLYLLKIESNEGAIATKKLIVE